MEAAPDFLRYASRACVNLYRSELGGGLRQLDVCMTGNPHLFSFSGRLDVCTSRCKGIAQEMVAAKVERTIRNT